MEAALLLSPPAASSCSTPCQQQSTLSCGHPATDSKTENCNPITPYTQDSIGPILNLHNIHLLIQQFKSTLPPSHPIGKLAHLNIHRCDGLEGLQDGAVAGAATHHPV